MPKYYETMSTFVEVMQRKLWPLFSGHVYILCIMHYISIMLFRVKYYSIWKRNNVHGAQLLLRYGSPPYCV